jgi:hypothetical protein
MSIRLARSLLRKLVAASIATVMCDGNAYALIDMTNFNYSNAWTDLPPKDGVSVVRTYNSRSLHDGLFGFGWCSDFETSVQMAPDGMLSLTNCGGGMTISFDRRRDTADSTVLYAENGDSLVDRGDGFEYREAGSDKIQRFDRTGVLVAIETGGLGTVRFLRRTGRITEIVDWKNERYTINYNTQGKISLITTPEFRIEYRYTAFGDLAAVKNIWSNVYTWKYDNLHNLTHATYPDETSLDIIYDKEKDLVTKFTDRDSCTEDYKAELSKTEDIYRTYVTKQCKGEIVTEGLYEFVYRKGGSLWKVRVSTGLPGPEGVNFSEVILDESGRRLSRAEKKIDKLHAPLRPSN